MPIVDGKQVLEMIRSETEFSDVPVIFLTGKNDKKSIMGVMSLKPNGYLLKSMYPIEIIRAVDEFFSTYKG
jgi:DNA-binding NarL/FixJ family response regulator